MSATVFSAVFAAFVIAALAWRSWLGLRQQRHVALHRESVPPDFAALIPPQAHRKAADYTLDKQRLGMIETWVVDGAGTISASISRDRVRRTRMTTRYAGGREAISHYKVLRRIDSVFGKFRLYTSSG